MAFIKGPYTSWWDKVKGKTTDWSKEDYEKSGFEEMGGLAQIKFRRIQISPTLFHLLIFVA